VCGTKTLFFAFARENSPVQPLQLGNYLLRIAPAATRVTINTTMMQHVPTLLTVFMAIAMWQYYTAHIAQ
jgi:hypothetical protein